MSRPNRKGWEGRVRPSRGWKVGEKNSIPAWSLLPRKVLVNVTLSSSSKNFPVTEDNISVVVRFAFWTETLTNGFYVLSTFLSFLVNVEIEWEEVFWKSFFIWQTLQQKHQLFLTQSLQPIRAKTPTLSTTVCEVKQKHKETKLIKSVEEHAKTSMFLLFIQSNWNVCWNIYYSHVTSLTLTSRLAFRTNVRGRGPPSSNKCKIWHGAGLSSTNTSEQNIQQSILQVTCMRSIAIGQKPNDCCYHPLKFVNQT